jgi:hypothetical protein
MIKKRKMIQENSTQARNDWNKHYIIIQTQYELSVISEGFIYSF